ncbi:MAG: hypothetical protein PVJ67_03915 [Candidatus Pacearchaeota archaeon]|jgi:hypothetical protein
MSKTKVDNVYILTSDGITVEKFHIRDLEKAKQKAEYLTKIHDDGYKYTIKIINEYVDDRGFGYKRLAK